MELNGYRSEAGTLVWIRISEYPNPESGPHLPVLKICNYNTKLHSKQVLREIYGRWQ
jgi:hypothetical protein